MASRHSLVFRANRETDLVSTRSIFPIRQSELEVLTLLGRGPGDPFVGVEVYHRPVFLAGDECIVVSQLGLKGVLLVLRGGADSGVGGDPELHRLGLFGGFNGDDPQGRCAVYHGFLRHIPPSFPTNNTTIAGIMLLLNLTKNRRKIR